MKEIAEKTTTIIIERPKMPRATWEALRAHIVRERLKKKQEQEQTEEFERQKKERERRKKQEALTLEETKEQIAQLEAQLCQHKEEKHQLFHTLKKVLYEDETRRRSKEVPQPHIYLQPSSRTGPGASMYMKPHPHILMTATLPGSQLPPRTVPSASSTTVSSPSGGVKRPKSPSPVHSSPYYRPPSGPNMSSIQGVPGVPAPKYVVYTTSTSSPSHLTAASIYASASMAAAPRPSHIPAHYSSYPGAAAASIHHSRLMEDERNKQQQHLYMTSASAQATANYLSSASAAAQQAAVTANYLSNITAAATNTNAVAHQAAANASAVAATRSLVHERQQQAVATAAAVAQMQQRAAVAAVLASAQQQQQQSPPTAHGSTTGAAFRPGSIMTGFPRYPVSTSSGMTASPATLPRMTHPGQPQQQQQSQRYYRD